MSRFFRNFILLLVLPLASCATFNVPADYSLSGKDGKGLLIMSLTHTLDGVTIDYRLQGGENQGAFMTGNIQDPMDWNNPKGRLVVTELPAGKYELYQWRSGRGNITYTSKPFSIPFVVVDGKATYIGNFFVNISEATSTYKLEVTDKSERDISLLTRKYKNIKESEVTRNISMVTMAP